MAIRTYEENGKKLYEVYVNGFNSRGMRVQLKRRGIETLQKSKTIEFELKRELANLKEEKVPYRFGEWFDVCMKRMRLEFQPSTIAGYEAQVIKWVHPPLGEQRAEYNRPSRSVRSGLSQMRRDQYSDHEA